MAAQNGTPRVHCSVLLAMNGTVGRIRGSLTPL